MKTKHCPERHNHRKFSAVARCVWPKHLDIYGEGPYATVSYCPAGGYYRGSSITVELHATEEQARKALDGLVCGGGCRDQHELVYLERSS